MNRITRAALAAPAMGLVGVLALGGPAFAADGSVQAQLSQLNGSGASGTSMVTVSGTTITVNLAARGLVADQPHAAHIHFGADARHECPTMADDTDKNGHLNTTEGGPAYGPVVVSLTKTGDTSAKSVLAIDRYDTANGGKISYERGSITVSQEVADAISNGQAVVVVHGVDYNHDGKYSGTAKSDLDPKLPTEATDPAICGVLSASQMGAMPNGGAATGDGSTTGIEYAGLIAAGSIALLTGAALVSRRRLVPTRR
ncbi:MAG: hypothetical protein QOJ90_1601 [Actinomycetota bacterium]|jgi:hypothetical protein|nr:hypothetical protein [Actinomycetota bacterium]